MDLEGADALITRFLHANWGTTPIAWPNLEARDFASPSLPLLPDGSADYLSVRSFLVTNTTVTIPGHCVRSRAQLHLDICVKSGTGVRTAKRHLSGLVALVENSMIRGDAGLVRFRTATGGTSYVADNGWWVEGVVIPFEFERYFVPQVYHLPDPTPEPEPEPEPEFELEFELEFAP